MKVNDTVAKLRAGLLSHELYAALGTPARVRVFMERHVLQSGIL